MMPTQKFWRMYQKEERKKKVEKNQNTRQIKKEKKKEIAAEIQAEKDANAHDKVLSDIVDGDYQLKKAETVDKSKLPEKKQISWTN